MQYVKAYIAGFLATVIFHQGLIALLHLAGIAPTPAWDMTALPPFSIPAVVSLALWGGLWGILLWVIIRGMTGAKHWIAAVVIGAIAPSVIALAVVFQIKGIPVTGDIVVGALLVNAAWGLGVALLMRLARGIG